MAALLLFGKDEVIRKVLPGRRIETKAQVLDYQGYDDQATIQTNLIDSYEQLMAFVKRNLPEGKRLPELPTVCTRDALFAEIISNLLLHRDYESQGWSRVTFQKDRIAVENPCVSGRRGLLDLARIQAFPKNPLLYRFFSLIHLAGEPGSGMRALARWSRDYFGTDVLVFDRDNFKIFATSPALPAFAFESLSVPPSAMQARPTDPKTNGRSERPGDVKNMQDGHGSPYRMQAQWTKAPTDTEKAQKRVQDLPGFASKEHASPSEQDWNGVRSQDSIKINPPQSEIPVRGETSVSRAALHEERIRKILDFCKTPRNREEIQTHIGLNNRDYFRKEILVPLLQEGRLLATIPDKPNSPKQQYQTPDSGR
jgi:hypothetical protein